MTHLIICIFILLNSMFSVLAVEVDKQWFNYVYKILNLFAAIWAGNEILEYFNFI